MLYAVCVYFVNLQKFYVDWFWLLPCMKEDSNLCHKCFFHGSLSIFRRYFECWCLSVMVKFIDLFVGMIQLAPSLSCSCCNFSLARRISTLNRLAITFLNLGHCMDSALRSLPVSGTLACHDCFISLIHLRREYVPPFKKVLFLAFSELIYVSILEVSNQ